MKSAFLIIAHNEFTILQFLLSALDDVKNDIYVHIDRKVRIIPDLYVRHSKLIMLDERIDVRWGNYSQIKCEFLLWETAMRNGPYQYYHLISGVHLPLKKQGEIHAFFNRYEGYCIFSNLERRFRDSQEVLKLHRYNFFTKTYTSNKQWLACASQFLWKSAIAVQRWLKLGINEDVPFYWANNWCSITQQGVDFLVEHKKKIIHRYRWSFCGDEWFVPTELMNSPLKNKVICSDRLLFGSIGKSNAAVLSMKDYEAMISSGCMFARKFSENEKDVVSVVLNLQ